jgi:murein DD-endopeptidase MepM/ murein hydrolase activator NlpD
MRRCLFFFALLLLPVAALAGMPAGSGTVSRAPQAAGKVMAARPRSGPQLTVPRTARLGDPFLIRLRSQSPMSAVSVTWLTRQCALSTTPATLRDTGGAGGFEALALLGTDIGATATGRHELKVSLKYGGRALTLRAPIEILPAEHPVEELSLDPAMVNPPAEALPRIAEERALVRRMLDRTLSRQATARLWSLPLARPVPGELSSEYGLRRVLNGQPRSPHRGMDLEAEEGQTVSAAADGVVLLAHDLYFAGNAVYLDHGQGLVTAYFHLSRLDVRPGERVRRGQALGLAGQTGRSTRAHLHFGVWALGRPVDPGPLLGYEDHP